MTNKINTPERIHMSEEIKPCGLIKQNDYYDDTLYEWAKDYFIKQQRSHWLPEEVPLYMDLEDYREKLTENEKSLVNNIFAFFTQADIDVAGAYRDHYCPLFKSTHVSMMLQTFASFEAIHVHAYAKLVQALGLSDKTFEMFMEHKEMLDKHEYLQEFDTSSAMSAARTMAAFSAFGEGLQLFASFAILMNFQRFNKLKGMCQIVQWSIRDESIHVEGMIALFKEFLNEQGFTKDDLSVLESQVREICETMVRLEDDFIDLAFSSGGVEGITRHQMKQYIRYIADIRMQQLGFDVIYKIEENPLPWMDELLSLPEHANFFETRATEYSKAATTGSWGDVYDI